MLKTIKIKALSLAVLFALSSPALSTETSDIDGDYFDDFYGSEEMVEIATGIKTQIYKAPAVANVFTAEQIKNMGATDIDDILETVPGLHVSYSSTSYTPIYSFRGVHSSYNPQVLMLVNGVPITNVFIGNRNQNWLGMPVESIARIEVIRGPGSAVYGADAFSGVINIISKGPEDIQNNSLGIRAGSHSTQDAWFSVANNQSELKYALTFEYHDTNGSNESIEADAQTRLDDIFGTEASNAPGNVSLGVKSIDVRAEASYQQWTLHAGIQERSNGGLGVGLGEALDPEGSKSSHRYNIDVNYNNQITDELEVDVQAAYFDTSQEIDNNYTIYPAGVDLGHGAPYTDGFIGNPEVWERHYRLNTTALYSGVNNHLIRFGIGFHKSDLYKVTETKNFGLGPDGELIAPGSPLVDVSDTPYIFLKETDRNNSHAFIQDVWNVASDWELTAGIRYDDYSDFGHTVNPRLALVWSTSLNLSTKLLYGKAFRAPSFAELGNINNPIALGNENVKPEEMETIELAFDYHPGEGIGAVLSFYNYQWSDIIQFVPDAGKSTKTAQNFGEQIGYGTEFEANWQINDRLKLTGNYTWAKASNDLTDNDVSFVPGTQVYAQVDWKINEEVRLHLRSNWVMNRKREAIDERQKIDDYLLTDFTVRWLPENLPVELSLITKNIFDSDAREPSLNNGTVVNIPNDLPLAGRTVLAEIRYGF